MALTKLQIALRRNSLGASDAPAIMGIDPFKNPLDIYLSKIYGLNNDTNQSIELGNQIEPLLLNWFHEHVAPLTTSTDLNACSRQDIWLTARPDGLLKDGSAVVEVKNVGTYSPDRENWDLKNMIPSPRVIVQTHQQMFVHQLDLAYVVALLDGEKILVFKVPRVEILVKRLRDILRSFWQECVVARKPPRPSQFPVSMNVIRQLPYTKNTITQVEDKVLSQIALAKKDLVHAQILHDNLIQEVILDAADADTILSDNWKLTRTPITSRRFDYKSFMADHPEFNYEPYYIANTSTRIDLKSRIRSQSSLPIRADSRGMLASDPQYNVPFTEGTLSGHGNPET